MPVVIRRAAPASLVVLTALAVFAALAVLAPSVRAESPTRLDGQVTDTVGALPDPTATQATLDELQRDTGVQLWVAYVSTFDGLSGQQWVDQTATMSGFGGNDVLFAVAVDDRAYGYWAAEDAPVSDEQLAAGMSAAEGQLVAGDWAGAVVALADSLAGSPPAPDGAGTTSPPADAGSGDSAGSVGRVLVWALALGTAVVVIALLATRAGRRRRTRTSPAGSAPRRTLDEVRAEAAAQLIEVDDAIRTSEQEVGFAIAQFGDEAAAPFSTALATSRGELQQAFRIQQDLHAGPVAEPDERAALERILALCRTADTRLDEQVEAFDALRDLDRTIDTVLPELRSRTQARTRDATAVRSSVANLAVAYPSAAVSPYRAHLDDADARLTFAAECVQIATDRLAAGDRATAVARARAAEEALGQADQLVDSARHAGEELAAARAAIDALVAETRRDVAEAESLGAAGALTGPRDHARATLDWAEGVLASGTYDPAVTRRALEDADNALETALGPARDVAAARARAQALLPGATDAAQASIRAAEDVIATRRGAVGADARTHLAAAQRHLATGLDLAASDPQAALAEVQQADRAADRAVEEARRDESRFRSGGGPGGMGSVGTLILGGILVDAMTRGRGPRMPGPRRGPVPGSFGGSATRGRRSGGGRF